MNKIKKSRIRKGLKDFHNELSICASLSAVLSECMNGGFIEKDTDLAGVCEILNTQLHKLKYKIDEIRAQLFGYYQ